MGTARAQKTAIIHYKITMKTSTFVALIGSVIIIGLAWWIGRSPLTVTKISSEDLTATSTEIVTATTGPASSIVKPTKLPVSLHTYPTYVHISSEYAYTARDIIDAVNAQRATAGLSRLLENLELDEDAQGHANLIDATGDFSSHNTVTAPWRKFITLETWHYGGENLADSYPTVDQLVAAWMASPDHRANILNPNYTITGIALADQYVVQLFAD